MQHLGALTGVGRLIIGDEPIGPTKYAIRVYRSRHLVDGRGEIEADVLCLRRIVDARGAILELECGQTVRIILSNWDIGAGRASIETSGPIPGF